MNILLKLALPAILMSVFSIANAQSVGARTYYDSSGTVVGSSRDYGSGTTYYNGLGAPVGRSANYSDAPMASLLPYTPQPVQSDVEGSVARAYRTAYGDSSTSSYQPLFIFPHVPY